MSELFYKTSAEKKSNLFRGKTCEKETRGEFGFLFNVLTPKQNRYKQRKRDEFVDKNQ